MSSSQSMCVRVARMPWSRVIERSHAPRSVDGSGCAVVSRVRSSASELVERLAPPRFDHVAQRRRLDRVGEEDSGEKGIALCVAVGAGCQPLAQRRAPVVGDVVHDPVRRVRAGHALGARAAFVDERGQRAIHLRFVG